MNEIETTPSRRRFLARLACAVHATLAAGLSVPFLGYLFGRTRPSAEEQWIRLGPPPDLAPGRPAKIEFEAEEGEGWWRRRSRRVAWLVRGEDRRWTAFASRCTHLGCPYFWNQQRARFLCPCHGGVFDVEGRVQEGPPLRPLDRHRVRADQGALWIEARPRPAAEVEPA
jgi:menaquinol-cytochrome c reductase iron-sulfur subunit